MEEYFPLYLRHQIQAVLKDDEQEGEGGHRFWGGMPPKAAGSIGGVCVCGAT